MSNKEFLETLLSAITSVSNGTVKQADGPAPANGEQDAAPVEPEPVSAEETVAEPAETQSQ